MAKLMVVKVKLDHDGDPEDLENKGFYSSYSEMYWDKGYSDYLFSIDMSNGNILSWLLVQYTMFAEQLRLKSQGDQIDQKVIDLMVNHKILVDGEISEYGKRILEACRKYVI